MIFLKIYIYTYIQHTNQPFMDFVNIQSSHGSYGVGIISAARSCRRAIVPISLEA